MKNRSAPEVLGLLRILSGLSLLIYIVTVLVPDYTSFFSAQGFIDPMSFRFNPPSWIFLFWSQEFLKIILFVLLVLLTLMFTVGLWPKWALLFLLPINTGLHLANPFIIHEPQQLTNLLLFLLFFLPVQSKWALRPGSDFMRPLKAKHLKVILLAMLSYLGLYYFFAGLKKLPDPNWLNGEAAGLIANWPFLSRNNLFRDLLRIPVVNLLATYGTLLFELSFVFIAFTKYRRSLITSGILFHLVMGVTLDVGLFFWAMLAWYPLLLMSGKESSESQDCLSSR